jgi:hypothetical protein
MFLGSYLGSYSKCAQFAKTVLLPGGRRSIYKGAPFSSTADASTPTCVFVYFLAGDARVDEVDAGFMIPHNNRLGHATDAP